MESSNCGACALAAAAARQALRSGQRIPRPERNVIRVLLQPCKQHGGRGGRHVFFFHHSPCARVVAAMPGINGYTIRRVAHLRPKRSPDAETLPCSCEETRNASRQSNAEKTKASTQKQSVRAVRRKELSFRFALRFFFWCVACDVLP